MKKLELVLYIPMPKTYTREQAVEKAEELCWKIDMDDDQVRCRVQEVSRANRRAS